MERDVSSPGSQRFHHAPLQFYTGFRFSTFFLSLRPFSRGIHLKCLPLPPYKPLPSCQIIICCRLGIQHPRWDPSAQRWPPSYFQPGAVRRPTFLCSQGFGWVWPALNEAEKGIIDTLNSQQENLLCRAVTHVTSCPAFIFHRSETRKM